jgi:hypothetical protein
MAGYLAKIGIVDSVDISPASSKTALKDDKFKCAYNSELILALLL